MGDFRLIRRVGGVPGRIAGGRSVDHSCGPGRRCELADHLPAHCVAEGCDISGAWRYTDSGEIVRHHDFDLKLAEKELLNRQSQADGVISPLARAVKYGMATDDERAALEAWERYSVLLSRVDTSAAPGVVWPEMPTV